MRWIDNYIMSIISNNSEKKINAKLKKNLNHT